MKINQGKEKKSNTKIKQEKNGKKIKYIKIRREKIRCDNSWKKMRKKRK